MEKTTAMERTIAAITKEEMMGLLTQNFTACAQSIGTKLNIVKLTATTQEKRLCTTLLRNRCKALSIVLGRNGAMNAEDAENDDTRELRERRTDLSYKDELDVKVSMMCPFGA